jgi:predicted cobalt transporter CbtA
MTRHLLIRGMLAGIFAAVLVTLFARAFAEPQVDLAIAYEASHAHADHATAAAPEPELVSRDTQKGLGLLTAVTLYGAAVGGIFSLIFAGAYGRIGAVGPRSLALLLALGAFVAIGLVPALKYPPTPPAVGQHETVGFRTAAYFAMIGFSLIALIISVKIGKGISAQTGAFNGFLVAAASYILLVALCQFALPPINEVPADFPAVVLWDFRVSAIALQAILWSVMGIAFGSMADKLLRRAPQARA